MKTKKSMPAKKMATKTSMFPSSPKPKMVKETKVKMQKGGMTKPKPSPMKWEGDDVAMKNMMTDKKKADSTMKAKPKMYPDKDKDKMKMGGMSKKKGGLPIKQMGGKLSDGTSYDYNPSVKDMPYRTNVKVASDTTPGQFVDMPVRGSNPRNLQDRMNTARNRNSTPTSTRSTSRSILPVNKKGGLAKSKMGKKK